MIEKLRDGEHTWWPIMALFGSMILLTVFNVWYTNHEATATGRKFCEIVGTLDDTYKKTPASSQTGRDVREAMHRLHINLDCKEVR